MALFKVYPSIEEKELPSPQAGHSYIIGADDEAKIARWLIDMTENERYGIASEGLCYKDNENDEDEKVKIATVKDISAKAYNGELTVSGWEKDTQSDKYYHQFISTPGLTCGLTGDVPPIISPADIRYREEYSKIAYAEADLAEENPGIMFYIEELPASPIEVTIVDYK